MLAPEDFTVELYRKVAELLYEQHAKGELNPAQIMELFYRGRGTSRGGSTFQYENIYVPEELALGKVWQWNVHWRINR